MDQAWEACVSNSTPNNSMHGQGGVPYCRGSTVMTLQKLWSRRMALHPFFVCTSMYC